MGFGHLNIPAEKRNRHIWINDRKFILDGADIENKIAYEFNGDYWHGHPSIYPAEEINTANGKTFGELYQKTLEKEAFLTAAGWKIISIWEHAWEGLKLADGIN